MITKESGSKTAQVIGIERLRMGVDGKGISTLVGFFGCPLECKYCINPQCKDQKYGITLDARSLYNSVCKDDLYYRASGGGITFGGGEPLLYTDFIRSFCRLAPKQWHITAETSLYVPKQNVIKAAGCIDTFLIDIKDTNEKIYQSYTKKDIAPVLDNLRLLCSLVSKERIIVRIPLIYGYNTEEDRERSVALLKEMGIEHFDLFEYDAKLAKEKATQLSEKKEDGRNAE